MPAASFILFVRQKRVIEKSVISECVRYERNTNVKFNLIDRIVLAIS